MVLPRLRDFLIARTLMIIPIIFLLLTLIFVCMHIVPGDPVVVLMGEGATPEQIELMRHKLGLDRPLYIQYLDYLSRIFRGDWGRTVTGERIIDRIMQCIGPTIELTVASLLFAVIFGISGGLIAAANRGKFPDRIIRILSLLGYAAPVFVIGLVLQVIIGVYLRLLPTSGLVDTFLRPPRVTNMVVLDSIIAWNLSALLSSLAHLILPAMALGISMLAPMVAMTRDNTVAQLSEDYILTARANGLPERSVIYKHAFRNALLPVVTLIGLRITALLGGSILIENVFSRPGLGSLLLLGITQRDFNLIQGCMVYYAFIIGLTFLIVDVAYGFLDPRVKY